MKSARTLSVPAPWSRVEEGECRQATHVLEIVGERWSASILIAMARGGAERFSEITALVPGLSARMLTVRLKQLESAGLVKRTVVATTPVTVRYRLTPRGVDLITALEPIANHVRRWGAEPDQAAVASVAG